jgi:hypothetical protein
MSWLFSRALVVAFSEANSSDGAACALWSGMPMPQACGRRWSGSEVTSMTAVTGVTISEHAEA